VGERDPLKDGELRPVRWRENSPGKRSEGKFIRRMGIGNDMKSELVKGGHGKEGKTEEGKKRKNQLTARQNRNGLGETQMPPGLRTRIEGKETSIMHIWGGTIISGNHWKCAD